MFKPVIKDPAIRRLWPLYVTCMLQGMVLWYAIEKVNMTRIGFSPGTIVTEVVIIYSVSLALEVPSGILADRWSRKGVLAIAVGALALTTLLFGMAHSVNQYLLASVAFGVYFACFSGLTDSIIYDSLLEAEGTAKRFEQLYGRLKTLLSIPLVAGSLLGAVVASRFGLQAAYLWSLPPIILSIGTALLLHEPTLHRQSAETKLLLHIRQTFAYVFKRRSIVWLVIAMVAASVLYTTFMQIDQLWPVALHLPLVWYGPLNALLLTGIGVSGYVGAKIAGSRHAQIATALAGVACTWLLTVHQIVVVAVAEFGIICTFGGLFVVANRRLHDSLPSRLRSGASSAVSSAATLCFIPILFGFGWLAKSTSVFAASYALLPIAVLVLIYFSRRPAKNNVL